MPEQTPDYVVGLATQLRERHPDLLSAENDLALLRGRLALVTTFIHNHAYDDTARRALAQTLGLPEPTPEKTHGH
jgi:ribosomal protein S15P/S13E